MNCPHCGQEINVGALMGSVKTKAKARSSRENGKKGGRPRKDRDANTIAHGVVAKAAKLTLHAGEALPPQRSKVLSFPSGSKRGQKAQPPSQG
jgi:hypothetical protein